MRKGGGEADAVNRLALSTQHQLAEAARWPMVAAVAGPDEADDADCTEACKLQFMSTPKHTDNAQLEQEQGEKEGKREREGERGRLLEGGLRPLRKLTICNSGVDVSAVPAVKFIQCRKIKTLVLSQGTHTHVLEHSHTHSLQSPVIAATTKLVLQSRQIALVLLRTLPVSPSPSGTCSI